jgi:hypothetical protein
MISPALLLAKLFTTGCIIWHGAQVGEKKSTRIGSLEFWKKAEAWLAGSSSTLPGSGRGYLQRPQTTFFPLTSGG